MKPEKINREKMRNPEKNKSMLIISILKNYNWTGNIRELRNVIERLIILGDNPICVNDIKKYASK